MDRIHLATISSGTVLLSACCLVAFTAAAAWSSDSAGMEYFYRTAESRAVSSELQNYYTGAASFYSSHHETYKQKRDAYISDSNDRGKMEDMYRYAQNMPDAQSVFAQKHNYEQISYLFNRSAESRARGEEQFKSIRNDFVGAANEMRGNIFQDAARIKESYDRAEEEAKLQRAVAFGVTTVIALVTGGAGAVLGMGTGTQLAVNTGLYAYQEVGYDRYGLKGDAGARNLSMAYSGATLISGGVSDIKATASRVKTAQTVSVGHVVDYTAGAGKGYMGSANLASGITGRNIETSPGVGFFLATHNFAKEMSAQKPYSIKEFGWGATGVWAGQVIKAVDYALYAENYLKGGRDSVISRNRNAYFWASQAGQLYTGIAQPEIESKLLQDATVRNIDTGSALSGDFKNTQMIAEWNNARKNISTGPQNLKGKMKSDAFGEVYNQSRKTLVAGADKRCEELVPPLTAVEAWTIREIITANNIAAQFYRQREKDAFWSKSVYETQLHRDIKMDFPKTKH